MKKKLQLKDVGISKNNQIIFKNFSYVLEHKKNVCLIGKTNVGKTLLLKAIANEVPYFGTIVKKNSCQFLFHILDLKGTIESLIHFSELSLNHQNIILTFLKLNNLKYSYSELNLKFKLKVSILFQVLQFPTFFFVDDILSLFSKQEKMDFLILLREFNITLFYVTSDIEDTLLFPYVIVMGRDGILIEGNTINVLKQEKIMHRLGFTLPFLVDLSLQLKSYEMIDEIFLDEQELIQKLWKSN